MEKLLVLYLEQGKYKVSLEVAYARKQEIVPRMIETHFYKNNTHIHRNTSQFERASHWLHMEQFEYQKFSNR